MTDSSNKAPGAALTGAFARAVQAPGRYGDGRGSHGLSLYVYRLRSGRVTKTWHQRIRVDGRTRMIALGRYPAMTLAQARAKSLDNAVARDRGEPVRMRARTFGDAARSEIKRRTPSWRDRADTRRDWERTLLDGFTALADRPIDGIATENLLAVLEPIWIGKPTQARKMLRRVRAVFAHAVDKGWISVNPAGPKLERLLPVVQHRTEHQKAIHWRDLPAAVRRLKDAKVNPTLKGCVLWTILSGCRSVNARTLRWEQIDEKERLWSVDGSEMKNGRDWRCPVTQPMLDLLYAAAKRVDGHGLWLPESGLVFPGRGGRPFSRPMPGKALKAAAVDCVPHGFRSTFKDWVMERTNTGRAVADAQLAHSKGDAVTEAYERTDLLDRRRELLAAYHEYALSP